MKIGELKSELALFHEINEPVFIHGSPGIGKSAIVEQYADSIGWKLLDIRLYLYDIVDFTGVPSIVDGCTEFNPPRRMIPTEKTIYFVDELTAAPPALQAIAYQIIHDRRIGNVTFPSSVWPIAAGNLDSDRAITNKLSTALSNRFGGHIYVEPNLDDWIEYQSENCPADIAAFLYFRPDVFYRLPDNPLQHAWPSPRTWEKIIKIYSRSTDYRHFSACIGEGASTEFCAFLRTKDKLPNVKNFMTNPESVNLTTLERDILYALVGAVIGKVTGKNLQQFFNVLEHFKKSNLAEFCIAGIKILIKRKPQILNNKLYTNWLVKNEDLF